MHHFFGIGDDGVFFTREFCQKMVLNGFIDTELHLFGIHKHQFKLRRMLFIKQGNQYGIKAYRFTLASCTRH